MTAELDQTGSVEIITFVFERWSVCLVFISRDVEEEED